MVNIKLIIFLALAGLESFAQSPVIRLVLNIKGEVVEIREGLTVKVVSFGDSISLQTTKNGFFIPDSLHKKRRTIILKVNNYDFRFDSLSLNWEPLLPQWIISIDYRPFLEENRWLVKNQGFKPSWYYSLNKGGQFIFTEFKKDKYRQIR